jgi:alpha-tubulin suppressor-like RCC1 family protein
MEAATSPTRTFVAFSCGRDHTLALLDTGAVFGWGGDGSGHTPAGTQQYCSTPQAQTHAVGVSLPHKALAVAAGYGVSLAITDTNQVAVWGANKAGIAGRLNAIAPAAPQVLAGMDDVQAVAAGEFLFGVVDGAGKVYTWGLNSEGALGRPSAQLNAGPGLVNGVPAVRQLVLGRGYMLALTRGKRLYAWGNNGAGQLGLGHLQSVAAPQREVQTQVRFDSIAAGATHSLGVDVNGRVYAWGSNQHGQLGQTSQAFSMLPTAVKLPERVSAVAAGMHSSLALGHSGKVYAWGWNGHGQLGLGDTTDRHTPELVLGLQRVQAIAAGETHVVALTASGLVGWGNNADGRLGDAAPQQRSPVLFFQST